MDQSKSLLPRSSRLNKNRGGRQQHIQTLTFLPFSTKQKWTVPKQLNSRWRLSNTMDKTRFIAVERVQKNLQAWLDKKIREWVQGHSIQAKSFYGALLPWFLSSLDSRLRCVVARARPFKKLEKKIASFEAEAAAEAQQGLFLRRKRAQGLRFRDAPFKVFLSKRNWDKKSASRWALHVEDLNQMAFKKLRILLCKI